MWQDDGRYVTEDGMDRDGLSALYKQVAAQISASVSDFLAATPIAVESTPRTGTGGDVGYDVL